MTIRDIPPVFHAKNNAGIDADIIPRIGISSNTKANIEIENAKGMPRMISVIYTKIEIQKAEINWPINQLEIFLWLLSKRLSI